MRALYELNFNYSNLVPCIILFILGISFAFNRQIFKKASAVGKHLTWRGTESIRRLFVFVGIALLIGCVYLTASYISEYLDFKKQLEEDNALVVEGYVEGYYPESDDMYEHFKIKDVYFEYSAFETATGYHNTRQNGGVITGDRQKLKIKYIRTDSLGQEKNAIVYIEELE